MGLHFLQGSMQECQMSIENKTKVEVSPARIRELRKEHGYSHQQLADKIIKLVDKKNALKR